MGFKVIDEVKNLETDNIKLSNTQKILLATDGSVTTILDVLNGRINVETLKQEFQEADMEITKLLNINKGEKVNYRVVVLKKEDTPLIHAISYIPISRLTEEFKEDLFGADIPIGRILRKHNLESRREVKSVKIEQATTDLKDIFNTSADFLSRDYNIVHNNEILIWIKETFPMDSFLENYHGL